jgi:hypothetical protein
MKKLLLVLLALPIIGFGQNWSQIGQDIDGETANDYSGNSVSLSSDGNTVAIGAYGNDGNGSNAGHVRVYKNMGGSWSQQGNDINGEAAYDASSFSVSLSSDGNTVAIGAYGNDGNGTFSGHVRVYKNMGGSWSQIGNDINGETADDYSGYSVSLNSDGNTVAIGAYGNDGNGAFSGHVRVYKNMGGSWSQIGNDINGEAVGDQSGYSVSLNSDGKTLAIGAYGNDGNGTDAGHVRVYQNVAGSWSQIGQDIDGEAANDYSGWKVSLSSDGNTLAIGAQNNDGNGSNAGHVRVYKNTGGSWSQIGDDIDGEAADDQSGISVSLSADGNTVAIGAQNNDGNGSNTGHVRAYQIDATNTTIAPIGWSQIGADIDGEAAGDQSGISVSLISDSDGNNTLAIGAYNNDGNGADAGHVRIYNFSITGCTDSAACNYYILATIDDGSCIFPAMWQQGFSICDGDSVIVGSSIYNTTGVYTDTLSTSNGCDSIVYTNISIIPPVFWQQAFSICNGDSIIVGSSIYNTPGVYTNTLSTSNGCDSIVYTNISIIPHVIWTQAFSICDGDSVTVGSSIYNTTGNYTDTLTTSNGCDSVVTTNLTIEQNTTSYDTLSVTASIVWNGLPLSVSGDYSVTLTNSAGCDSIANLNLTVITTTGISDIANNKSKLVKIIDMLGQETPYRKNTPLFYIFDDGIVEKKIIIE